MKKTLILCLIVLLCFAPSVGEAAMKRPATSQALVYANGQPMATPQDAFVHHGLINIDVAVLAQRLGWKVEKSKDGTLALNNNATVWTLDASKNKITIDGQDVSPPENMRILNGRVVMPPEEFGTLFDVPVEFEAHKVVVVGQAPRFIPDPAKPMVAFTFDDGPQPNITEPILNDLAAVNGKATFMMLGTRALRAPELVRRVVAEGHEIGSHTLTHRHLSKLTFNQLFVELDATDRILRAETGLKPRIIRPPYGDWNPAAAVGSDRALVRWNIDSHDWEGIDAAHIRASVGIQMTDGDIILLHDVFPATAEAFHDLLNSAVAQGMQPVTITELLYFKGMYEGPGAVINSTTGTQRRSP